MKKELHFSDEQLNAYIDGQLDVKEQAELLTAIRENPELGIRNCELQKVHELVRLTYYAEPVPTDLHTRPQRNRFGPALRGIAAVLLLGIGILIGWLGSQPAASNSSLLELARTVHNNPASNEQDIWKVMLHVSTDDQFRLKVVLDEAENLLRNSLQNRQRVEVEILTNGKGLELVRNSQRPYARKLQQLQDQYSNLVVSACNQALQRLQQEKGITLELLPETRIVPSAINEVLKRQKQGWTYIRI